MSADEKKFYGIGTRILGPGCSRDDGKRDGELGVRIPWMFWAGV